MTDLQTSLFAIGGAIVVAVVSYNKWQEHKAKKTVERAFSSSPDDVLMAEGGEPIAKNPSVSSMDERIEPVLSQDSATSAGDTEVGIAEQAAAPIEATQSVVRAVQKPLPVDDLIDCEIPLELDGPVRGDKVLPALQSLRHVGGKPVHYIGQTEDGNWEPVAIGSVYLALRAGVQLANRSSALNELEYSEVVMRLRQAADEIAAEPFVPDMTQVIKSARALHQFVLDHDAQLGVNVQSRGAPWAVNTLLAALERQGFDLRPDGRLVMQDGDSGVLFLLTTNVTLAEENTSRLTLLLDVPKVARERDGFGAMVACARMLAARLDGIVVDDAGEPLGDATLAEIASQVNSFYADMDAAEIPAGSTRAQRLFS